MALQPGQTLNNRYLIVRLLGQGGMGAVYLAEDLNLGRKQVAIKENLDVSQAAQDQFRAEALILARLSHPGLPQVTDHFVLPSGAQYLVMQYVEGEDLEQVLARQGPLPERDVLDWMAQVLEALQYMHTWVDSTTGRMTPVVHRGHQARQHQAHARRARYARRLRDRQVSASGRDQDGRPGRIAGLFAAGAVFGRDRRPFGYLQRRRDAVLPADRPDAPGGNRPGRGPAGADACAPLCACNQPEHGSRDRPCDPAAHAGSLPIHCGVIGGAAARHVAHLSALRVAQPGRGPVLPDLWEAAGRRSAPAPASGAGYPAETARSEQSPSRPTGALRGRGRRCAAGARGRRRPLAVGATPKRRAAGSGPGADRHAHAHEDPVSPSRCGLDGEHTDADRHAPRYRHPERHGDTHIVP